MTEHRPIVEYRKVGDQNFFTPARDYLYIYHRIIKAAAKIVSNTLPADIMPDEDVPRLGNFLSDIYMMSLENYKPLDILDKFNEGLATFPKEVQASFIKAFADAAILEFIEAVRFSVDKPELSAESIIASIESLDIMGMMDKEDREKIYKTALQTNLLSETFGKSTGMYRKIEKEEDNIPKEK